jgi:uncharacterized 2Fe-2S/4Fe-4S cluster protein (DUF4445 family)
MSKTLPDVAPGQSDALQVDLEPIGARVQIPRDQTLLDAAQAAGVELAAVCGGVGLCGKCRVRLMTGRAAPLTEAETGFLSPEETARGDRLACQCWPVSDVKVDVPPESLMTAQRLQVEGLEDRIDLDPVVVSTKLEMDVPDLRDLRSDTTRLLAALQKTGLSAPAAGSTLRIGLPILAELSPQLRAQNWTATMVLRDGEIAAILPPDAHLLGLAVDIGTTKMAAYLVDLQSGATLAKGGVTNPQVSYGEDVLSRIAYTNEHQDGRNTLQTAVVERLNRLVADLCAEASAGGQNATPSQIVEAVLVGNTAMHHLFTGLPVRQLGFVPYVPAVAESLRFPAHDIGLKLAPGCSVYLPPNIAGFVGGDHVSMLVATQAWQRTERVIAIDIGTNTEISLVSDGRLLACSCASGPAFEGAHIRDGMRAVPGAIEKIKIQDTSIFAQTVDGLPPVGICGSGILDAIAEMYQRQIVDRSGRMYCADPGPDDDRYCNEFVLVPANKTGHGREIAVTLADVREIQLAKGAIRAGIEVLLKEADLVAADIDEFVVAGAFGTYLDLESAMRIGMFPALPLERFKQVGNAAGMGAKLMLTSRAKRQEAAEIADLVEYIELTTHPGFTRIFAHALRF